MHRQVLPAPVMVYVMIAEYAATSVGSGQKFTVEVISDYASIRSTDFGLGIHRGRLYQLFWCRWYDVWVLKLDAMAMFPGRRLLVEADTDQAYSVQQTVDGGYIVAGYSNSFGDGSDDLLVLKLD